MSQAKVSAAGSNLKLFVELRDMNYPGSNYSLFYDAASDQLKGVYLQAVEQQRYEVFFVRLN